MHKIKYTRYPNNEIRAVHYYSADKKSKQPSTDGEICDPHFSDAASPSDGEEEKASLINLTLAPISDSAQANLPFKRTKFGSNAKNTILRIGGSYDTLSTDPNDFVFLTGTLPGNTPAAFRAIAEYSSHIAESIGHWIKRTVESDHYFYVWELQKRGALHFHYCVYCPDSRVREKICTAFKPKWTALLDSVSEKSNVCLWESSFGTCHTDRYGTLQAYAQQVHTSVAAYLCGYLGGAKNKHLHDKECPYYPQRWWGASRASTRLLKSLTETTAIEYSCYRDAKKEMALHYEQVLHDSPKVHRYNHTVGCGSTVVSYHPEDKGTQTWQLLNPMLYQTRTHMNTVSTIVRYRTQISMTFRFLEALPKRHRKCLPQSLALLKEPTFAGTRYGWSINQRDLRTILEIPCDLNSPVNSLPMWESLRIRWWHLQDSVKACLPSLVWDKHGYLANTDDVFKLLDEHPSLRYVSTTDPDEGEAALGAAHGSISPRNPLPRFEQLEIDTCHSSV